MPHMARYESWKLADVMTPGSRAHCTVRAKHSIFAGMALRPVRKAVSLSRMKRNALTIDGEAPVITE